MTKTAATTYTATFTTPEGKTITDTRTSHRPYTHAAVYRWSDGQYAMSFHSSAELAKRGSSPYARPIAVVTLSDATAATVAVTADDRCDGTPAPGQGARLIKKCGKCNHEGSARAWRKHKAK